MPEGNGFTPRRVLMCPPVYYKLPAMENVHMDMTDQPSKEIAWSQWLLIRNLYEMLGLNVFEVEPHPRLHSMVFAANGAWGVRNGDESDVVLSNFVNPTRQGEEDYFEDLLGNLGCNTFRLPESIYFEGQGDVITTRNYYLFGTGKRSQKEASDYLKRLLGLDRPIIELELRDDRFYHLDTCLMSLQSRNALMYCPEAFSRSSREKLASLNLRRFTLSGPAAMHFIANSVFVDNKVLLNVPFDGVPDMFMSMSAAGEALTPGDPRLKSLKSKFPPYGSVVKFLWDLDYEVIPVYTSEFKKSGAGIRCLTLFVD